MADYNRKRRSARTSRDSFTLLLIHSANSILLFAPTPLLFTIILLFTLPCGIVSWPSPAAQRLQPSGSPPGPSNASSTSITSFAPRWRWIRRNPSGRGDSVFLDLPHQSTTRTVKKAPPCSVHCAQWITGGASPWNQSSPSEKPSSPSKEALVGCECMCPSKAPTLLLLSATDASGRHQQKHIAECTSRLVEADCHNPISFASRCAAKKESDRTRSDSNAMLQLPSLPSLDYLLAENITLMPITLHSGLRIAWEEASIRIKELHQARCELRHISYLDEGGLDSVLEKEDTGDALDYENNTPSGSPTLISQKTIGKSAEKWVEVKDQPLLRVGWDHENAEATLAWNRSALEGAVNGQQPLESIVALLHGSILRVSLDCISGQRASNASKGKIPSKIKSQPFCLAFKIVGQLNNSVIAGGSNTIGGQRPGLSRLHRYHGTPTRVTGDDDEDTPTGGGGRKLESILVILLTILLVLSLAGSTLAWTVCWRVKKRELVERLQIQFLYHMKHRDKMAASGAGTTPGQPPGCKAPMWSGSPPRKNNSGVTIMPYGGGRGGALPLHPNQLNAKNAILSRQHHQTPSSAADVFDAMGQALLGGGMAAPDLVLGTGAFTSNGEQFAGTARVATSAAPMAPTNDTTRNTMVNGSKRKLYFSPEFFEPQLMSNPPPMAEQFLHDLRRMIAIAKQRIMLRRYVCRLGIIPEETDDELRMAATLTGLRCFSEEEEAEDRMSGDEVATSDENPSPPSSASLDDGIGEGEEDEESEAMKEAGELETGGAVIEEAGESDFNTAPHKESSVSKIPISKFPKSPKLARAVDPTSKCENSTSTDATPTAISNGEVGASPQTLSSPNHSILPSTAAPPVLRRNVPNAKSKLPPTLPNRHIPPPPPNVPPPPVPTGGEKSSAATTPPYLARAAAATARRQTGSTTYKSNSYAVFPTASTEQMLKKSLPRRSKKRAPPPTPSSRDKLQQLQQPNGAELTREAVTTAAKRPNGVLLGTTM